MESINLFAISLQFAKQNVDNYERISNNKFCSHFCSSDASGKSKFKHFDDHPLVFTQDIHIYRVHICKAVYIDIVAF